MTRRALLTALVSLPVLGLSLRRRRRRGGYVITRPVDPTGDRRFQRVTEVGVYQADKTYRVRHYADGPRVDDLHEWVRPVEWPWGVGCEVVPGARG